MNLRHRIAALALSVTALATLSGCTTEAYCFTDCETAANGGGSGGASGSAGNNGQGGLNVGGNSGGNGIGGIGIGGGVTGGSTGCGLDEICDGQDNDCDGEIDEDFDFTTPETCGNCATNCRAMLTAVEQDSIECTPPAKADQGTQPGACSFTECTPDYWNADGDVSNGCEHYCIWNPDGTNTSDPGGAEGCGKDDDCDGQIDEDVDTCDVENCGRCGKQCVLPNATAQCDKLDDAATCTEDNTQCAVKACATGFYDVDKLQRNGCEYECTPSGAEICDNVDNDCDGLVDNADPSLETEDPDVGDSCKGGTLGICAASAHAGYKKCISGVVKCCDKASNDVTGTSSALPATGVRNGVCEATAPPNGVLFPGDVDETCNATDDDCDGKVNEVEDMVGTGAPCGPSEGVCEQGTQQCVNNTLVCQGGTVGSTELCNATDDDCDGVADGTVPATVVTCTDDNDCTGTQICLVRSATAGGGKVCATPSANVGTACAVPPAAPCWNPTTGDAVPCTSPSTPRLPQSCSGGTLVCSNGSPTCVDAVVKTSSIDKCGEDTNCDGSYDAERNFLLDENNCGGCGIKCGSTGDHINWFCDNGVCKNEGCQSGFANCGGDAACETACVYRGTEQCNGQDDDCDCKVDAADDNLAPPPTPIQECGVSSSATDKECKPYNATTNPTGVQLSCVSGSWACSFASGYCTTGNCATSSDSCETSPEKDNNCNGVANEGFKFPTRTSRKLFEKCFSDDGLPSPGHGACRTEGQYLCTGDGSDTECSAVKDASLAVQEACNGDDDDCDGLIDEYKNTNVNGSYVQPAVVDVGGTFVFQYEASRPNATTTSSGSGNGYFDAPPTGVAADETPACSNSSKLPWFNVTPLEAEQTCAAIGGRLCSVSEWTDACNGTANSCTWAYAAQCTVATDYSSAPFCNLEYYTSSVLETNSATLDGCYSELGTSDIFDLTGNLREITASGVMGEYNLMGGAFTTDSPDGAACDFDFYTVADSFSLFDTGFRCCFDESPL